MYCPNCGGANADSYGHCTHCGAPLPADHYQPPARPSRDAMLAQSRPTSHTYTLGEKEIAVYQSIRKLCTGPVFITAMICFCISIIVQMININSFGFMLNSSFGSMFGKELDELLDSISGFMFVLMIPGILTAVGLIITFVSAQMYQGSGKISAAGLRIIWVLQIISLVGICLFSLFTLLSLLAPLLELGGNVMLLIIIILGILGLGIANSICTVRTLAVAIQTLDGGYADSDVSGFVGVMCCIFGGISILSGLTMMGIYFDFSTFASGIATILFGVVIFQYKSVMFSLEGMSYSAPLGTSYGAPTYSAAPGYSPAPSRPAPPPTANIPTWKRIEMEEQNKQ